MPKQSRRANRQTKKSKKQSLGEVKRVILEPQTFSTKELNSFSKYMLLKQKNEEALVSYAEKYNLLNDSEENKQKKYLLHIAISRFQLVNWLIRSLNSFYTGKIISSTFDKNLVYTEKDRNLCKMYIDIVQSEGKLFIYSFNKNELKFRQYYSKVKQGQSSFLNTIMFDDISDSNIELPVGREWKVLPLNCDEFVRIYATYMKSMSNLVK